MSVMLGYISHAGLVLTNDEIVSTFFWYLVDVHLVEVSGPCDDNRSSDARAAKEPSLELTPN
jgi:hypothetical protein